MKGGSNQDHLLDFKQKNLLGVESGQVCRLSCCVGKNINSSCDTGEEEQSTYGPAALNRGTVRNGPWHGINKVLNKYADGIFIV